MNIACTITKAGRFDEYGRALLVSQSNADIDTVIADAGFGMINAHDFGLTADATYKWSYSDTQQFVGRLAALRDAGTIEIPSWTKWYADLTGRPCGRR